MVEAIESMADGSNPVTLAVEINYTPRGDRVLVKRKEVPAPLEGGVFLPNSQQKPVNEGTVIAVGPDIGDLQPGDQVCFVDHAGYDVEVDGETYLQMRDEEVIGIRKAKT